MGLVFCPECNKKVSQYAETCPECGFPIKKFMDDNNITDVTKAFVCPKCAKSYYWDDIPLRLKCEYCDTVLVQTDISMKELRSFGILKVNKERFNNKTIELAKQYGNNQFSQEDYNNRLIKLERDIKEREEQREFKKQQTQQQNVPKCPKCGSTAITAGQRGYTLLTGFLGSNKTVNRCANCGHTWKPGR